MSTKQEVIGILKKVKDQIKPVMRHNLNAPNVVVFDFSGKDERMKGFDISDTPRFTEVTFALMRENGTPVGIGRYNENRTIYAPSALFKGVDQPRTVHLGIDLWAEAGTPVFVPLLGRVHSFRNNDVFGDYGPTIILEHNIDGITFYTLYGHLSLDSIAGLEVGQEFNAGQELCRLGNYPINGGWPPHLHFQIMTDMQGKEGDFPGVASLNDRERFLDICLDPNLILQIKQLI